MSTVARDVKGNGDAAASGTIQDGPSNGHRRSRIVITEGKAVDIHRKAWEEGLHERPATAETEPDSTELAIIQHWEELHREAAEKANHRLQDLAERFAKEEVIPKPEDAQSLLDDATNDFVSARENARDSLVSKRVVEREVWNERQEFRDHAKLKRPASFPESKLHHFAIIIVIVLIESVANMYFFAQGSSLGYLGGLLQSILLSLMNVGLATAIGYYGVRSVHRVEPGMKAFGIALIVAYAVFLVGFNLVAAHYRDLLTIDPDGAIQQAIPATVAAPFRISFDSLLLMIAGFLAAGLGLMKGYTADDRYPGYGRLERRYREVDADYDLGRAGLRSRYESILRALEANLAALRNRSTAQIDALEHIQVDVGKLKESYENDRENMERECCQWLAEYRDENMKVRVTQPPGYFDKGQKFPEELDPDKVQDMPGRILKARVAHGILVTRLDDVEANEATRFSKAYENLDAFFKEVEVAANAEIGSGRAPLASGAAAG